MSWKLKISGLAAGVAMVAAGLVSGAQPADAAACRVRVAGTGTGQGIFGAGTQNARIAAIADWEKAASKRFGARFAKFDKAKDKREACQSGALQAKCVITAKPCR